MVDARSELKGVPDTASRYAAGVSHTGANGEAKASVMVVRYAWVKIGGLFWSSREEVLFRRSAVLQTMSTRKGYSLNGRRAFGRDGL